MSTIDFIRSSLKRLHASYDDSVTDLSSDQLHWRANEHGCAIAFALWHYVRTEDNIMQLSATGTASALVAAINASVSLAVDQTGATTAAKWHNGTDTATPSATG